MKSGIRGAALAAATLVVGTSAALPAQATAESPQVVGECAQIGFYDATLSDDGDRVAWNCGSYQENPGSLQLFDRSTGDKNGLSWTTERQVRTDLSGNGRSVVGVDYTPAGKPAVKIVDFATAEVTRTMPGSSQFTKVSAPSISTSGNWVTFTGKRTDYPRENVYRWDVLGGNVTRVTSGSNIGAAVISGDGTKIAYRHNGHSYLRTVKDRKTVQLDVSSSGTPGDGVSSPVEVSHNGNYVLLRSQATNLAPGSAVCDDHIDEESPANCLFRRNVSEEKTTPASVDASGETVLEDAGSADLSSDGRVVSFTPYSPSSEEWWANARRFSTAKTVVYSHNAAEEETTGAAGRVDGDGDTGLFTSLNPYDDDGQHLCEYGCLVVTDVGV